MRRIACIAKPATSKTRRRTSYGRLLKGEMVRLTGPCDDGGNSGSASLNDSRSAESSYCTWVDQHNAVGLGENISISTTNLGDGFVALRDGKFVVLRIPYPMSFFAKGLDARIDDPNARWQGPGL